MCADDDKTIQTLVGKNKEYRLLLDRIYQHWIEGVSEDTEHECSWHGTMRDLLSERLLLDK